MARSGRDGPVVDPPSAHPAASTPGIPAASTPGTPAASTPGITGLEALGAQMKEARRNGASPTKRPRHAHAPGRGGAAVARSTFDEAGLRSLGERIDEARGRHRRLGGRHRKATWIVGSLAAVIVIVVVGAGAYAWHLDHEIRRIDVRGLTDVPTSGADAGTENILMVGSTDRCALAVQNPAYGLCSQGVDGVNSDVVMILHLDPSRRSISVLSVPRDLFVPNARTTGANKIDAALYQGPSQLVAAITEDLGIPIQHYVVLNFDSFANVVDKLGGVKMYFPEPVYDAYSGLDQLTTGCVSLDGLHALQVVRARHLQYKGPGITTDEPEYWPTENQSDLARIRRDHEFLRVLGAAVAERGLSNPITDEQLVSAVAPQLDVDRQLSASDMVDLVLDFHSVDVSSAPQLTLPVQVDQFGSYTYKGGAYGDVEFPSAAQDQQVIDRFLGIGATTDTMTGKLLPAPGDVSVSVLNGTATVDQATTTAASLQALGFRVAGVGDATPVGREAETVVYYAQKTPVAEAAAQTVAHALSGAVITAWGPTSNGAQVTVVTGSQFAVDQPAPTAAPAPGPGAPDTTSSTGPSTTVPSTTVPAGGVASGAFQPPTAAVTPLQPWDPRSCNGKGGAGA